METYSPFKLDEFWNDCIDKQNPSSLQSKKHINTNRNKKNKNLKSLNTNTNKTGKKINLNRTTKNTTKDESFTTVDTMFNKYNNKYPGLFKKISNNKNISKKGRNNPLSKSISLYEDGMAKKKILEKNMEENNKKQIKDEMALCTFRPKISKRRRNEDGDANPFYKRIYERDLLKIQKNKKINKSVEVYYKNNSINENSENENRIRRIKKYSNRPKNNNFNKSEFLFKEKENADFILRYTKARDERMIKKFKKLYKKDESYDYYLNSLTSRIGNREYKNALNVNNIIPLYGETITRNDYIHSSIGEFKGLSYDEGNHIKQNKKEKKQIMNIIRKGLLDINFNSSGDI